MNEKQYDQTLALAGIFQAATLVQQIAWKGSCELNSTSTCINSIFKIDSQSVIDVFDGTENLNLGLQSLVALFSSNANVKDQKCQEIARYTISIIHLERKLMKEKNMLDLISKGIARAKSQAEHFTLMHENVMANLASIYADTLSTFNFRIHITGNQMYLTNPAHTNKIRSLLLAGIRAAVLWRQMGGNRLQLVFSRKTYCKIAARILEDNKITIQN